MVNGERRGIFHGFIEWLVKVPVTPGFARTALLAGGALFILFGVISGQRARIGYQTPGTPLYRQDSKVNRDIAEIGKYFPTDVGWIVLVHARLSRSAVGHRSRRHADDRRPCGLSDKPRRCGRGAVVQPTRRSSRST